MGLFDNWAAGVCQICKQVSTVCDCWGEEGELEAFLDEDHEWKKRVAEIVDEIEKLRPLLECAHTKTHYGNTRACKSCVQDFDNKIKQWRTWT